MTRGNIIAVGSILVACAVLVAGISLWLGDRDVEDDLVINDEINEPMLPLTAAELDAYQVSMTNKSNPVAKFITSQGELSLELFEDTMPITSANFIKLAEEGFYDGTKFHRVIKDFMIQGGDPISKTEDYLRYGTGGPDYSIPDEHVVGEYLTNVRGTISMANSGPNSGGSQFFINVKDNTFLDFDKEPLSSKHPVFGRVIEGMDVVDKISLTQTNSELPVESIVVEKIEIIRGE